MSTTIEDKISLFTKVLIERIEHDFQEKQKKLVDYYEARKSDIIKDYEERKRAAVNDAAKDAEIKKQQMISKAKSTMHLAVLKKRHEFTERIMDEVKERARAFTNTAEYVEFLKEAIKKVSVRFSGDSFVNYIFSRNDFENHREIISSTIKSFRDENTFKIESNDSMIGGVFAKSGDGRLEIDFTVNTTIEESRKLVGEILSSRLSEGC
ncbi:H(+)-transporting ATPase [Biomaibacter acetigenes]|uniref:H(+)-transporting ATPase n=1 Tax=Biomaibacter acetigenes TaxID=2316383 RepID=A0A3G2R825_9FIRM|nr:V-type ATP synthase subunit E [Biomaibacter acetigenes]AYO31684.1 H(+)-transporting ATPase [Biomaibacter acetigenes]